MTDMLHLAPDVLSLHDRGIAFAFVTVIDVAKSAPHGVGTSMLVTVDGQIFGSISGGCIESDAGMLAQVAISTGRGQRARFGFSDDTAHAAGLACGGSIEVVAYPIRADATTALDAIRAAASGAPVTVGLLSSGPRIGQLITSGELRRRVSGTVRAELDDAVRQRASIMLPGAYDGDDVAVLVAAPKPRLIILGGGEHAAALCRVASAAGYAVTVCDVWDALVTRERFPAAEHLVAGWPHEFLADLDPTTIDDRTAICVLTHDTRQDVPALRAALSMPVGFVGAMGARSTVAVRAELLRAQGVSEVDLARLHSPLGLDLGGSSPDDTAVSVLAEIVAARHGGSSQPLRERTGPVHRSQAAAGCSIPSSSLHPTTNAHDPHHRTTESPAGATP